MEENKKNETGQQAHGTPSPKKKDNGSVMTWIFIGVLFVMLLVAVVVVISNPGENQKAARLERIAREKEDSIRRVMEATGRTYSDFETQEVEKPKKEWSVSREVDPMTDKETVWKSITSKNGINQDFPYEGYTQAHITVRKSPKYGTDVYVQIDRGQINGNEYRGTNYVTVRFDKTKAKRYYFNEAASGSSDIVFLQGVNDFIRRAKEAKSIKMEVPVFEYGDAFFEFEVDEPLEWP